MLPKPVEQQFQDFATQTSSVEDDDKRAALIVQLLKLLHEKDEIITTQRRDLHALRKRVSDLEVKR